MAAQVGKSSFDGELLDRLLAGRDPKTVLESEGLIGELKKALAERMLNAELDVHLDQDAEGNHRNGSSSKTVRPWSSLRGARCRRRPSRSTTTARWAWIGRPEHGGLSEGDPDRGLAHELPRCRG